MMIKTTLSRLAVFAPIVLCGCGSVFGSSYERPIVTVPAVWAQEVMKDPSALSSAWWKSFNDNTLNDLVDEALAKNNDLAAAAFKVKQARLKANLAVDQFLPDVSASASASNSQGLRRTGSISRSYSASVSASYEVDLWGKLSSDRDSADWESKATEQDRESAAIALIGTTVDLYWKIAYLNEQIAFSDASIAYQKKTLELAKVQHDEGAISSIDLALSKKSFALQEAAHTQYLQQKVEAMNAFDILFDSPPGTFKANPTCLPKGELKPLATGVPATLLERRPDLRAAEHRLRESLTDEDAVRMSYLPGFSLTGSLGSSSVALTKVLTDPVGMLGAGITLPFLNWYDMKNNIAVSEAEYEEAVVSFRQTLYTAFADVENALSAQAKDAEQGRKLREAFAKAIEAEELYGVQYKEGYISLQTWLDAQESRRNAESSVLENIYNQLNDRVTLYKALGGDVAI